jgi:hypothetical protein
LRATSGDSRIVSGSLSIRFRQAARRAHNVEHEQRLADELRKLWARYAALERVA